VAIFALSRFASAGTSSECGKPFKGFKVPERELSNEKMIIAQSFLLRTKIYLALFAIP